MFIYNLKLNSKKSIKLFFLILFSSLLIISIYFIKNINFLNSNNFLSSTHSCIPKNPVCEIKSSNYTNVLKAVHENIDNYVGTKIKYSGYLYKVFDLEDNQFILARDMVVSKDFKTVVVGFLCNCNKDFKLNENSWVEITGTITKGDYHGDMPIIEIDSINIVAPPTDEYVYPPSEDYIMTNSLV